MDRVHAPRYCSHKSVHVYVHDTLAEKQHIRLPVCPECLHCDGEANIHNAQPEFCDGLFAIPAHVLYVERLVQSAPHEPQPS